LPLAPFSLLSRLQLIVRNAAEWTKEVRDTVIARANEKVARPANNEGIEGGGEEEQTEEEGTEGAEEDRSDGEEVQDESTSTMSSIARKLLWTPPA
jgi:hypothetical protein